MHKTKKNVSFIGLMLAFLIGVLGFFLRAQETLSGNYLFLLDQGRDLLAVRDIVFHHHPTLIGPYTSLGGVFQGPIYYYLLAIPTFIFNGDPWGSMLLMLLISMSVLVVVFYCINKYFGIVPALITLLLFAVSPEAVAAATYIWNPHSMWLVLVAYIFILFGATKKYYWMKLLLWPIVALTFHFETAFGVFLSVATAMYILVFYRSWIKEKVFWISMLLGGCFFLPQILFDVRHNFLMTQSVLKIFSGSNQGLLASGENHSYLTNVINNMHAIQTNFDTSFIHDGIFINLPAIIFLLDIAIAVFCLSKKLFTQDEKNILRSIVCITGVIIICGICYPFPLRYWFLTGFQSFYLVATGILLSKIYTPTWGKIVLGLLVFVIAFSSFNRLHAVYDHADYGGTSKIKGKIDAIDYIYQDAGKQKFGVIIFTPPVLTDAYAYLFWWYGSRKYAYIPNAEKKGTVYLLIEPDPGKPWSYKGWLETVIKTGTVIKTKTLPSGIIIQKREFAK